MGGEQSGLSAEISGVCDVLAKIPMRAGVESLNLAISTAIMLYQLSYNPRPKTT
jgi:tRNA G18 (ribose-2'-O)-methylase SpoU